MTNITLDQACIIIAGAFEFARVRELKALCNGRVSFAPRLPSRIGRLAFRVRYRGRCISVTAEHGHATYRLVSGTPTVIAHHGDDFELAGEPIRHLIPKANALTRPTRPTGREPRPRGTPK